MQPSDLIHLRLSNQLISRPAFYKPEEVVAWLGALQAQDYAGAKWSVGMRMKAATDAEIERAFNEGAILRTHLLRPTWHFVAPDDIRWMLALTAPRVHAVNATMYRRLGLDEATFKRSSAALQRALQGNQYLTRTELRDVLHKAGIAADGTQRLAYLMMHAELERLICSGPRRGNQFTYGLLDEQAPSARTFDRENALEELARRYLRSRGPATVQDFSKWSGLTITDARNGLEAVRASDQNVKIDGQMHWFSTSELPTKSEVPTAHLLSIYDEYISGYKDHRITTDERYREKLLAQGNTLSYIIVLNGQVAGTWRRTIRKGEVSIEIDRFRQLSGDEEQAVITEARRYGKFHNRPVIISETSAAKA